MNPLIRDTLLVLVVAACVPARGAHAQGMAAATRAASPDPAAEIARLRALVDSFEERLSKLEKERLEILEDEGAEAARRAAEEAKATRVEQRLASLEKAQQSQKPTDVTREAPDPDDRPLTVTAPFVVKDRAGKVIMVVQEGAGQGEVPGGSRGLYIYGVNQSGSALAHVGAMPDADTGRVYVAHEGSHRPDVIMAYHDGGPLLALNGSGTGKVAMLDRSGIAFFNSSGNPVTEMRSKDGRGLLLINGPDGSHMVEAGSLAAGKGYVLANPWQPKTDLSGDPSVLMGGKKP